jgi:hypothetical protein
VAETHELSRLRALARSNLTSWQRECMKAQDDLAKGNEGPMVIAAKSHRDAQELLKGIETLLGRATGWAEANGLFGVFTPSPVPSPPVLATCLTEGCDKPQHACGLCSNHYQSQRRRKLHRRQPCINGRKNHAYNRKNVCVHCYQGRSP